MAKMLFTMQRTRDTQVRYKVVARNDREARQVMRKYYPDEPWFDERRNDRQPAEKFDEREVLS